MVGRCSGIDKDNIVILHFLSCQLTDIVLLFVVGGVPLIEGIHLLQRIGFLIADHTAIDLGDEIAVFEILEISAQRLDRNVEFLQ